MASCNVGKVSALTSHSARLSRSTTPRGKSCRLNPGLNGDLMTPGARACVCVCVSAFQATLTRSWMLRRAVSESARGNSSFPLALNHRRSCLSSSVGMSFTWSVRCHTASEDSESFGAGLGRLGRSSQRAGRRGKSFFHSFIITVFC